ncbi:hypothetical protein QFZ77_004513 [Paenibacillus sp. V4I3]|uniref:hypothetical protein n=1 Tax=unclassified Paenibacillus TaxID=185978 RepID=UPI002784232C|nr:MULTISPECIES: hypothetical protein [unclassified Paenibacillus]MDQ0875854.1 hypothetical protein [Paenibacillus sp. V4I3]MDQ0888083.1 hypothetical protein [Paenibacillus sp. V4I9]
MSHGMVNTKEKVEYACRRIDLEKCSTRFFCSRISKHGTTVFNKLTFWTTAVIHGDEILRMSE